MGALLLVALKWVFNLLFGGNRSDIPAIQAEAEQKQAAVDTAATATANTKALETHIENAAHTAHTDSAAAVDGLFDTPDAATRHRQ